MKTPWHLWLVGALSLLWNAMGVWQWYQELKRTPGYIAEMTLAQVRFIETMPVWVSVAFGLAVWGGVLGALALLLRRRLAFNAYIAALIGFLVNAAYVYVIKDGATVFGMGAVGINVAIFAICLFEIGYARWMAKRGVLR